MKKLTIACTILLSTMVTVHANALDKRNDELLANIAFLEIEENVESDPDLVKHLPDGFDPYIGMLIDPVTVHFKTEEAPIHLGFDTAPYLPKDFNPYVGL